MTVLEKPACVHNISSAMTPDAKSGGGLERATASPTPCGWASYMLAHQLDYQYCGEAHEKFRGQITK